MADISPCENSESLSRISHLPDEILIELLHEKVCREGFLSGVEIALLGKSFFRAVRALMQRECCYKNFMYFKLKHGRLQTRSKSNVASLRTFGLLPGKAGSSKPVGMVQVRIDGGLCSRYFHQQEKETVVAHTCDPVWLNYTTIVRGLGDMLVIEHVEERISYYCTSRDIGIAFNAPLRYNIPSDAVGWFRKCGDVSADGGHVIICGSPPELTLNFIVFNLREKRWGQQLALRSNESFPWKASCISFDERGKHVFTVWDLPADDFRLGQLWIRLRVDRDGTLSRERQVRLRQRRVHPWPDGCTLSGISRCSNGMQVVVVYDSLALSSDEQHTDRRKQCAEFLVRFLFDFAEADVGLEENNRESKIFCMIYTNPTEAEGDVPPQVDMWGDHIHVFSNSLWMRIKLQYPEAIHMDYLLHLRRLKRLH